MCIRDRVTAEQIILVKANITRLEELRDITQAFYDNGMAMEVDVKRVNINLENLKVQHDNAQATVSYTHLFFEHFKGTYQTENVEEGEIAVITFTYPTLS